VKIRVEFAIVILTTSKQGELLNEIESLGNGDDLHGSIPKGCPARPQDASMKKKNIGHYDFDTIKLN
jgi:hypothetical protein